MIALSSYYGFSLKTHKYLGNVDQEVVKIAANSLVESGDIETIKYLTNYASMTPRDTVFLMLFIKFVKIIRRYI